jgi:hypothetical protein
MKLRAALPAVAVALVFGATPSLAAATHGDAARPTTPDSCIVLNQGDWNACNVGNGGSGDLPYKSTSGAPNACIVLNQGDWNACNVSDSRRSELP